MNTQDKIQTAAADEGWTHVSGSKWRDEFVRNVFAPPYITKLQEAGGVSWQAQERVVVHYNDVGGVTDANYAGPGQQAALDGHFAGFGKETKGPDRRGQIIKWLEGATS